MTARELILLLEAMPENEKDYTVMYEIDGFTEPAQELYINSKRKTVGLA